jgi:hypothetical protein
MFRPDQLSRTAFGSIVTRHGHLKARNETDVLYIGLGDNFDDDRRLVRGTALATRGSRLAARVVMSLRQSL